MLQIIVAEPNNGSELNIAFSTSEGESTVIPVMMNSLYTRQKFQGLVKSHIGINKYWASLPQETQARIFDLYYSIDELCSATSLVDGNDTNGQARQQMSSRRRADLHSNIRELISLHDWATMRKYFTIALPSINVPNDIEETIPERYRNQPKDKTYVREEYQDLVMYLYYYRFFVPVIAMLSNNLKHTTIPKDDREFYIYKELAHYAVFKTPEAERLKAYVDSYFIGREHQYNRSLNLNGLSHEDIPNLVKARVFIKALATTDPFGDTQIITGLSNALNNKLNNLATGYNNVSVRDKVNRKEKSGEDKNLTVIESFRIKTAVSNLAKGALNRYSKDLKQMLSRWVPEKDLSTQVDLAEQAVEHFRLREIGHLFNPTWTHIGVAIIDGCGVETMINDHGEFDTFVAQQAVAITALSYLGFEEVALMLSTDFQIRPKGHANVMFATQVGQILTPDLLARFDKLYPYYNPEPGNKPRSGLNNYGLMVVDQVVKEFNGFLHTVNGPLWLLNKTGVTKNEPYELPADIKQQLAELVLFVGERVPLVTAEELFYKEFPELRPTK